MMRIFFVLGSLFSFLAVALGAFAAHLLKDKLTAEMFNIYEVGVRYHFYHALALFVVAWAISRTPDANFAPAGWLFVLGIVLFSGSLYALSLTGIKPIGIITPFGGLCFLAGWFWLAWTAWKAW
jgi:uncharacterized membrane protein YgdD (TMEM256/DUF423 family)